MTIRTTGVCMDWITGKTFSPESLKNLSYLVNNVQKMFLDFRDECGDPYPPELKGSPEFDSVTTVYKNTFGTDSEDNLGGNQRHPQPSGLLFY